MVRTKVFVGNISFKIRENQLVETFAVAGKVAAAKIITRGQRSLGYGFVEMESEEEAHRSVELLNKKEIDGRPINVEVAKPHEEGAAGAPGAPQAGGASGSGEKHDRAPRRRFPRGPPRGPPGGGAPLPADGSAPAPLGGGPAGPGSQDGRPPHRRFRRPQRPFRDGPAGAPGAPAPEGGARQFERRPRAPRPPREPRAESGPRNPSATTLFVANLPFSVDDQGLAGLFQGLNIKNAHVVMKHNGRSKGFGFVEFQNEGDQHAALQQVDQKEVEGRKIIVKVALTENRPPVAGESSSPAPEQK